MPQAGIHLLRGGDPLFMASLPADLPATSDVLLPYSAMINNEGEREIFAYSVRWTCTAPNGNVVVQESTVYDLSTLRGVAPHTRQLVPGNSTTRDEDQIGRLADFYRHQESIEISLDAVVFEDGSTEGLDTGQHIPRIKAWVDAERDLSQEVQSATSTTELTESLTKLRDDGLAQLTTPALQRQGLGLAANRTPSYRGAYKLAKGYFAQQMLGKIQKDGPAIAVAAVQGMASRKRWPEIQTGVK